MKKKILPGLIAFLLCFSLGIIGLTAFGGTTAEALSVNSTGTINNLVVFIRFSDQNEFADDNLLSTLNEMYNSSDISVKNYFKEVSNSKLNLNTVFLSASGTVSYQDTHPKSYYQPKSASNSGGYDKSGNDSIIREQQLLKRAVDAVSGNVSSSLSLDNNGDGNVDSLTFIINGAAEEWDSLLWPHMTTLSTQTAYINGKKCRDYNFQLSGYIFKEGSTPGGAYSHLGDVGVLAHELMHVAGAPDYYHYLNDKQVNSVGELDIMDYTEYLPQYPLSYLRAKLGWIDDGTNIVSLNESGEYTLYPVNSDNTVKAYKIVPYAVKTDLGTYPGYSSTGEYFMLEVRDNTGLFDSSLSASGLVIYRVDESAGKINSNGKTEADGIYGNMYGPPDEVYVFRSENDNKINENRFNAIFGNGVTRFGSNVLSATPSQNTLFYQGRDSGDKAAYKDKNSGIIVSQITLRDDGSVSFKVTFPDDEYEAEEDYTGLTKIGFSQQMYIRYPYIENGLTDETSVTLKLKCPQGNVTAYYIVAAADSALPTYFQVKKGTGYTDRVGTDGILWEVYAKGSVSMAANMFDYTKLIKGLRPDTSYTVYVVVGREGVLYSDVSALLVTTSKDTEKPVIELELPETSEIGSRVSLSLVITDNVDSVSDIDIEIAVYYDGSLMTDSLNFFADKLGVYTIVIKAADSSGNLATLTKEIEITDISPPEIYVSLPEIWQTGTEIRITPLVKDNSSLPENIAVTVAVYFEGEPLSDVSDGFIPLKEGVYTVEIAAEDEFGNTGTLTFVIEAVNGYSTADTTPPTVVIDTPSFYNGDAVEILYRATDNITDGADLRYTVLVTRDGEEISLDDGNAFEALLPGEYILEVTAVDEAGNEETARLAVTLMDITPPSIVIELPEFAFAGEEFIFGLEVSDDYSENITVIIELEKDGVKWIKSSNCFVIGEEGSYTLTVTARDEADNETVALKSFTVSKEIKRSFAPDYPKAEATGMDSFKVLFSAKVSNEGYYAYFVVVSGDYVPSYSEVISGDFEGLLKRGSLLLPNAAEYSVTLDGFSLGNYKIYAVLCGEGGIYSDVTGFSVELKNTKTLYDLNCLDCVNCSSFSANAAILMTAFAGLFLFAIRKK